MLLMTPWVQRLLLANIVVYLLPRLFASSGISLAFAPNLLLTQPWTLLTYMFVHGGFGHLFFNMLMLFFFGPRLEERLGSNTFIRFYLLCGVGGAVLSLVFFPFAPFSAIVGASGAVYGVVIGFARYWPKEEIYIWGVLPIQARMLAIFMVASSLFAGFRGAEDGIAHFAHLGGLLAGWIFLRVWERRRKRMIVRPSAAYKVASAVVEEEVMGRWTAIETKHMHEINREELEKLLDKANRRGVRSLTHEEKAFLDRMANSRIGEPT